MITSHQSATETNARACGPGLPRGSYRPLLEELTDNTDYLSLQFEIDESGDEVVDGSGDEVVFVSETRSPADGGHVCNYPGCERHDVILST